MKVRGHTIEGLGIHIQEFGLSPESLGATEGSRGMDSHVPSQKGSLEAKEEFCISCRGLIRRRDQLENLAVSGLKIE